MATQMRHPAFQDPQMPTAFDPSPHALTPEEVSTVENALLSGQLPRARLVRKMLRIAPKVSTGSCFSCGALDTGPHRADCSWAKAVQAPMAGPLRAVEAPKLGTNGCLNCAVGGPLGECPDPPSQAEKISGDEES
jgi:hypothetical protein